MCHITSLSPGANSSEVLIRPAQDRDLEAIVDLHRRRLPHGFFVRLGSGYLRAYHRTFLGNDSAVALVAEKDQQISGFIVGAVDAQEHRESVLRSHGVRLAVSGLLALAARPTVALEFARTRLGRYARALARAIRRTPSATSGHQPGPRPGTAVLTHVAVDVESSGRGAGSLLVRAFTEEVRQRGARRIELVTLTGREGAADFYRRLGWRESGVSAASATSFHRFVLDLR